MKQILKQSDIINENIRMFLENDTLVSLNNYPKTITHDKLKQLIANDYMPNNVKHKDILQNRNINNISETISVIKGITTNKTILKYLPTHNTFYISKLVEDNIATAISAIEPLLILHTSLDNKWYYVQTYYYRGWILKDDILIINDEVFNNFLSPKKFVVVTNKSITIKDIYLDMGVKIPYILDHYNNYEVLIPTKNGIEIVNLNNTGVNRGYLSYTSKNILKQALKYLNTKYNWGGVGNGIDCSSLIVNIFKTFGLYFPRDTKEQEKTVGLNIINLKGKTTIEKKKILDNLQYPFLLYKPGHVLLSIYKNTVIHAYGKANKVIISKTYNSYGDNLYPFLSSVNILVKKQ